MSDRPSAIGITIRNVLGVKKVDLKIKGIALIAGTNYAGKSSLLHAVGAGLMQAPGMRGVSTKKMLEKVVTRGAKEGVVEIAIDHFVTRVTYPSGEVEMKGPARPEPSRLASGLQSFSALPLQSRLREVSERLHAFPTAQDLHDFLAAHDEFKDMGDALDEDTGKPYLQALTDSLMERIDGSGWDSVHKSYYDERSTLSGRWRQVTKEEYGNRKADGWRPKILLPGQAYDEAATLANLQREELALEELLKKSGVTSGERGALQADVTAGNEAAAKLADLQKLDTADEKIMRDQLALQNAQDAPIEVEKLIKCPGCGKHIREFRVDSGPHVGFGRVFELVELPTPAEEKEQREKAIAIRQVYEAAKDRIAARAKEKVELVGLQRTGERAQKRLDGATGDGVEVEAITAQRRKRSDALEVYEAVRAERQAGEIFGEIRQVAAIVEALAPGGVRGAVLRGKIDALNTEIADIAKLAGFPPIRVDANLDILVGEAEVPVELASVSEIWRVDFVFAVIFARREGVPLFLLDALDVLVPQDRPGPLKVLHRAGLHALVAMSAKDRGAAPNLAQFKMGETHWMQAGEIMPPLLAEPTP